MTIQRVTTQALHQTTLGDVTRVQSNIANLQNQISSGRKTDNFQGLGNQVEHFVQLESRISKSETYIENNAIVLSRVNTTRVVVDDIIDLVDDIENFIVSSRNVGANESLDFNNQISSMRDRLDEMLNTNFDGRYLFGGTRTNAPPISDNPVPLTPGVPDANYYEGSSEDVVARVDDNIEINYGVRADAEGFQKVYAAISLAIESEGGSDPERANALDLIQDGLQDIIAEQTTVNSNIVAIENITARHNDLQTYWAGVSGSLINTDIVEASTQLAVDQTVLQAAFQSFASLNRLRLIDFL